MIDLTTSSQATEARSRWKWFLALGALLVVLGIAGVSVASFLQLTTLLVFAPFLLVSSLFQFLTALWTEERREKLLHFAAAGLELALGFAIMAHPPESAAQLIAVIAVVLVASGLLRLARSLATQSHGRAWMVMTGVIAVLLGISVWVGGAAGKLWFVGLCIAVDFLCHGVSWSGLALMERKGPQAPPSYADREVGYDQRPVSQKEKAHST